ncbi:MAG: DEAD/DEAH box helicase family protein [Lactobacillaceae bacterium]|jgi:type III restriction enzyme|nr:DEAD/DEAH box helicase family protein [Lactobacillaceae bacterium]
MKLQYKQQQFQLDAVNAVTQVFAGQPKQNPFQYLMDTGANQQLEFMDAAGFKNADIALSESDVLNNIQSTQKDNGILTDNDLHKMAIGGRDTTTRLDNSRERLTLTIEMETGTGKTYTYIKTMFELHKLYGWSKFIIVVPSIAIREGVAKTFESTADHFALEYGINIRPFIYNSSQLDKIEAFASDAGINVMIVNTQAFNARGADARRIDMVLDQFRGRRPIDVIAATNPIMIIDEPQSVLGDGSRAELNATRVGLAKFNPLFFINYSATHRENYNMVYRLDAVDAYQKQLVKKISVKGIEISGSNASSGYMYVERINEKPDLKVKVHFEQLRSNGKIVKTSRLLDKGDNLYQLSGEIESYRSGYVVSEINAVDQFVEFTNGIKLSVGEVAGNANDDDLRRIQIRETIKSHLNKESQLFKRGIKTLSLFFIDEVVKYKDYDREDTKGLFALMFEEEYENIVRDYLTTTLDLDPDYKAYLEREIATPEKVHAGYFSVDKKGKSVDSKIKRGSEASDDISAYDLIMKNKERLLSFEEPVRFIFSHSALKEGWDNPNVFQIATLRQSSSDIKKRQEIGRGLRLSVNQNGDRQDAQSLGDQEVQQVNVLTVIANESYETFARDLQSELAEAVKNRPKFVEPKLFEGRELVAKNEAGETISTLTVDNTDANEIWFNLKTAGIITKEKQASDDFKAMTPDEQVTSIYEKLDDDYQPYAAMIQELINSVYDPKSVTIENENKRTSLKLNRERYASQEFKNLWAKINHKSYYTVDFDDEEIIKTAIDRINRDLTVAILKAKITEGSMKATDQGTDFKTDEQRTEYITSPSNQVKYDLIGEVAEIVGLLRKTVARILSGIDPDQFAKYKANPESFIANVGSIINAVKSQNIVSHIIYNKLEEVWDEDAIFANNTIEGIMGKNVVDAKKHLYDKVRYDSETEKRFAGELDLQNDVAMYVKLPGGFYINTPVGHYNPDWAVVLNESKAKHVYFVAETKGVDQNIQLTLKGVENARIESARKHFEAISEDQIIYDVVDSYESLMEKVMNKS